MVFFVLFEVVVVFTFIIMNNIQLDILQSVF